MITCLLQLGVIRNEEALSILPLLFILVACPRRVSGSVLLLFFFGGGGGGGGGGGLSTTKLHNFGVCLL